MVINLYSRTMFIDEVIYSTDTGLVESDLKTILMKLPTNSTVITDPETLIKILRFIPTWKTVKRITTNAPCQFYPIDFAESDELNIAIGATEHYKFIHQISFNILSKKLRVGTPI